MIIGAAGVGIMNDTAGIANTAMATATGKLFR